ncbi:hypothetical protein ON010_g16395 [Phytophthora cinnamomi]|nr:hypothetical protein ON010_g16395 [Phytophthora cinnamomi]
MQVEATRPFKIAAAGAQVAAQERQAGVPRLGHPTAQQRARVAQRQRRADDGAQEPQGSGGGERGQPAAEETRASCGRHEEAREGGAAARGQPQDQETEDAAAQGQGAAGVDVGTPCSGEDPAQVPEPGGAQEAREHRAVPQEPPLRDFYHGSGPAQWVARDTLQGDSADAHEARHHRTQARKIGNLPAAGVLECFADLQITS